MCKAKRVDGVIFDIKRYATHDGPGIRSTVFLSGCPLRCWWCHNPEGLEPRATDDGGQGGIKQGCVRRVTVRTVMEEVRRDTVFYDQSGGGVTFSGGEPFAQPEFLSELLDACRAEDIHTTIDTCGYVERSVLAGMTDKVDLFLYDIKLVKDDLHSRYTGVSNAPILDNYRLLAECRRPTIVRFPVIPGMTDTSENIDDVIAFLLAAGECRDVSLLPYHRTATAKYKRLGLEDRMQGTGRPSAERMAEIRRLFEERGFRVKIGG
jgi:pyruvate formate lyase activating enzyme